LEDPAAIDSFVLKKKKKQNSPNLKGKISQKISTTKFNGIGNLKNYKKYISST